MNQHKIFAFPAADTASNVTTVADMPVASGAPIVFQGVQAVFA